VRRAVATSSVIDMHFEAVADAMRHAHRETIAPRFRTLVEGEIEHKSPGEVVTIADRECEEFLGPLLRDVADVPVVGEEGTAADPSLVGLISTSDAVWLVDPIDGTANFADGSPEYAVMVAYVEHGRTTASWIWQPQVDRMAIASLGAGATINGTTVTTPVPEPDPMSWRGVVKDRFLPPELRAAVEANLTGFGARHQGSNCAGIEYPALVAGRHTFLFYWRTLPWDHAPGVLLAQEAGCSALRPDGRPFSLQPDAEGLLVAHHSAAEVIRDRLLG